MASFCPKVIPDFYILHGTHYGIGVDASIRSYLYVRPRE